MHCASYANYANYANYTNYANYANYTFTKLAEKGLIFDYVPVEAKEDKEFVMYVVGINGKNYLKIDNYLREDADVAILSLKSCYEIIDHIPGSLMSDKKFMLRFNEIIKIQFRNLKYGLSKDKELCLICLRNGSSLECSEIMDEDDEGYAFEAVQIDLDNFKHVGDNLLKDREFILRVLNAGLCVDICNIEDELYDDREIALKAVSLRSQNFNHISAHLQRDKEIVHAAVKRDYSILKDTIFHDDTELQQYKCIGNIEIRHKKFIRDMPCDIFIVILTNLTTIETYSEPHYTVNHTIQ